MGVVAGTVVGAAVVGEGEITTGATEVGATTGALAAGEVTLWGSSSDGAASWATAGIEPSARTAVIAAEAQSEREEVCVMQE